MAEFTSNSDKFDFARRVGRASQLESQLSEPEIDYGCWPISVAFTHRNLDSDSPLVPDAREIHRMAQELAVEANQDYGKEFVVDATIEQLEQFFVGNFMKLDSAWLVYPSIRSNHVSALVRYPARGIAHYDTAREDRIVWTTPSELSKYIHTDFVLGRRYLSLYWFKNR